MRCAHKLLGLCLDCVTQVIVDQALYYVFDLALHLNPVAIVARTEKLQTPEKVFFNMYYSPDNNLQRLCLLCLKKVSSFSTSYVCTGACLDV